MNDETPFTVLFPGLYTIGSIVPMTETLLSLVLSLGLICVVFFIAWMSYRHFVLKKDKNENSIEWQGELRDSWKLFPVVMGILLVLIGLFGAQTFQTFALSLGTLLLMISAFYIVK